MKHMSSHHHRNYYALILCGILIVPFLQAHQYVYPIATLSDDHLLVMYQKSADSVELLLHNTKTKETEQILPSRFRPSLVVALPDNTGFSFIDNGGIIRIARLHKRSPRSLEFSDPFYDINSMIWDNLNTLYISAKQHDRYKIFCFDIQGNNVKTIFCKNSDFLYPQKQGNNLFFINRSIDRSQVRYALSDVKFDGICNNAPKTINARNDGEFESSNAFQHGNIAHDALAAQSSLADSDVEMVFDFGNQPVAFLTMENENSGFVVAHQSQLRSMSDDNVPFSYVHVYRTSDGWRQQFLFNFSIPFNFLTMDGQNRLYEQIRPLLPKKIDDYIYYTHAANGVLNIFKYRLSDCTIGQVTFSQDKNLHYFCPLKVGNAIYCGQTCAEQNWYDSLLIANIT